MKFLNISQFKSFKISQAQKNKILLLSSSLVLMLSFQNCANSVKFQGGEIAQSKALGDGSGDSTVPGAGGGSQPSFTAPPVAGGPVSDYTCEDLGTCDTQPSTGSGGSGGATGTTPTMPPSMQDPTLPVAPGTVAGGGGSNPQNPPVLDPNVGPNPPALPPTTGGGGKPDGSAPQCDFRGLKFKLHSFHYFVGNQKYEYRKGHFNKIDFLFDLDITVEKHQTDLVFSNGAEVLSIDGSLFNNSGKRLVKHFNDIDDKGHTCQKMQSLTKAKGLPLQTLPNFDSDHAGHFKRHIFNSMFELKVAIKFDCETLEIGDVKFKVHHQHHNNGHHYGQTQAHHDHNGHDKDSK